MPDLDRMRLEALDPEPTALQIPSLFPSLSFVLSSLTPLRPLCTRAFNHHSRPPGCVTRCLFFVFNMTLLIKTAHSEAGVGVAEPFLYADLHRALFKFKDCTILFNLL